MSSRVSALAWAFLIGVIAGCGSASPASSRDGGGAGSSATGAGGAAGDTSAGAAGDTSMGAAGNGAAGDNSVGGSGGTTGAAGDTSMGAAGGGGMSGAGGQAGGQAGAGGRGGAGGTRGTRDGGVADARVADAGALAACKRATTCAMGDPPCLRACGGGGRDVTCECGTGVLAGRLVCEATCARLDAGAPDGGTPPACAANIRSGMTACTPRTETTCDTPCANMMHRQCTCVAGTGGARSVWFCFGATTCT
jgi:hypothetical protein